MIKAIILAGLGFTLLSCTPSNTIEDHLYDYSTRMANILEVEQAQLAQVSLPPYPKINTLKQSIPSTTIKLTDFYGLKHCELYSLVAERNTVLGRIQLPSTRYIYETKLLKALQTCLSETTNPQLQSKLSQWLSLKEQQLPKVWANLVQTSTEIKHGLSTNTGFIHGTPNDGLNETKAALHYLMELSAPTVSEQSQIEHYLKQLLDTPLPAQIWHTQLLLSNHLEQLTHWLTINESKLGCDTPPKKQKLEYLTNVFRLFFIEKIQPIAGQLNHYHYQLTPIIKELVNHPHLSPSFKQYIHTQHTLGFVEYSNAMTQHLTFWQELFKNCNIAPQQI
ncbi:DUF3080 family protein [Paraglaciecola marina]|uniref:DUF3080 family protein n=1 Tax=Paraglaciecola marina TaxID=2500157 RepID=UPI001EF02667|nr:DUF3080 family protein [Paraglaciecola marina]